jgi:hypothetical protein
LRLIKDVQLLKAVTIKESGMPPLIDEFSEDFAEYPITTAIDYFSGYYEVGLDPASCDMTPFVKDVGLIRMTRLPQGWTFQWIISKVHWPLIPHSCRPFHRRLRPQRTEKPIQRRRNITWVPTIRF